MQSADRGTASWILERTKERGRADASKVASLAVPIHRAAEHLSKAASKALRKLDLQRKDFEVLQTLLLLREGERLTPSELYGALLVTSGGLTKILDRLQERGSIVVEQDERDRRRRLVALTGAGKELGEEAERLVVAAERDCLCRALPVRQLKSLELLLPEMIDAVEASLVSRARNKQERV